MKKLFKGKKILVTGGTGSIGSEIVRQVLGQGPEVVRIYSRDEHKQYLLRQELKDYANVRYLIGDVRDAERLRRAVEDIDIVFHAAALKHVPACEYNPFEAIKTNVLGTQNVIDCALDEKVEKLVAISTDKVVNPCNTLGATKLLSEKLIAAANTYKGKRKTSFSCVRFGNVLGSRGSVLNLFMEQISRGGPVTVTHPEMTRFVMSIPEAVELVLKASEISNGGETFILKMPALKIIDLIEVLIEEMAPKFAHHPKQINIQEIGLRPGEKMHEGLLTPAEAAIATEFENMYVIPPGFVSQRNLSGVIAQGFTSENTRLLIKKEIAAILYKEKLLWLRAEDINPVEPLASV